MRGFNGHVSPDGGTVIVHKGDGGSAGVSAGGFGRGYEIITPGGGSGGIADPYEGD